MRRLLFFDIRTTLCPVDYYSLIGAICFFLIADMEKEWSKTQSSKRMRVEALYRDAALSYQEAGRHQAAAEALGRAAGYLEGIEPEVARFLTVPIILIP